MSRPTPGRSRGGQVIVDISEELIATLKKKAVTLRKHIIRMTHNAQSGHPGGSMSAADIVTALYFHVLRVDPKNPTWPDRDRFVLSKGHAWEAAMASSKYGLDNLTAFIDRNGIQQEGRTEDIMPLEPLAEKWEAFNWHVLTIDGHDFRQILAAIEEAHRTKGRPTAVISRTVKGKGVSFMENKIKYHGAATSDDELKLALAELEAQEAAI